jgi:cytoskeletal protein CcmA (bactofilin family)
MTTARQTRQSESNIVNSIIGEGSEFKGEFKINGLLRIDGRFKGTIETDGKVLIGQSGEALTDIRARLVVIGGTVKGNIFATERVFSCPPQDLGKYHYPQSGHGRRCGL